MNTQHPKITALPVLLVLLSAVFLAALHVQPQPGDETVGLVFRPGTGFPEAALFVEKAGGHILEPGSSGNVWIARFEGGHFKPPADAPFWFAFSARPSGSCLALRPDEDPSPFTIPYPSIGAVS